VALWTGIFQLPDPAGIWPCPDWVPTRYFRYPSSGTAHGDLGYLSARISLHVNVAAVQRDAVKDGLQGRYEIPMVVTGDRDHPVEATVFQR